MPYFLGNLLTLARNHFPAVVARVASVPPTLFMLDPPSIYLTS
jgi:hypothetical protein